MVSDNAGGTAKGKLPFGKKSGLSIASRILRGIDGIGIFEFSERDVVRHSLVRKIISAYDKYEREYETKRFPPVIFSADVRLLVSQNIGHFGIRKDARHID